MEIIVIKALQLILSLSILIVIHELGHFLFARLFGIRVEKFYLFFDPWFSLFKFKPKGSDTEYGIGWLPLGGYVKISGMIDDSMDKEQMARPEQPWEFRSKPAWQRLLVMAGGVLFNVLLAIFIYSMIVFAWGDSYTNFKDLKHGMMYSEAARQAGLQDGDKLISADGEMLRARMDKTLDMNTYMQFANAKELQVERDGKVITLQMPEAFADSLIASRKVAYTPIVPSVVDSVAPQGIAHRIGIKKGDRILTVNNADASTLSQLSSLLKENIGKEVKVNVMRGDSTIQMAARIDSTAVLGIATMPVAGDVITDQYSFLESFPAGLKLAKETLQGYVGQLRFVFTKEGASNLGGFAAIGNLFPAQWDWLGFWFLTAFLSIMLAVMNLLPIPALDGGHIMFLLYEIVARRKPSDKFMEYATTAGMILLFALLIYANGNDIFKAFFK